MDNRSAGGLTILIDHSGACLGATSMASGQKILERHPTNNFLLKGWQAPFYSEVCELALTLAKKFFFVRCVGWDIVISDKGVCVIEGNNSVECLTTRGIFSRLMERAF